MKLHHPLLILLFLDGCGLFQFIIPLVLQNLDTDSRSEHQLTTNKLVILSRSLDLPAGNQSAGQPACSHLDLLRISPVPASPCPFQPLA